MSIKGSIPMEILSRQLGEAVDGRRVRAGVFTTFTFDPGFFELHILSLLFDQTFSQVDKVRRIQLEDALRKVDALAVYYDRGALSQDAEPAVLDYRRVDVRRATGVFHPKVILLLVDEHAEEGVRRAQTGYQSLIVAVTSANLTRAGWWESVECAHIEEIKDRALDGERCPFRRDLLFLTRRIRESGGEDEDHLALDMIRAFLLNRTEREKMTFSSHRGHYFTRLFCGQGSATFSEWLSSLNLKKHGWNLEVISPFFDATDEGPLGDLVEAVQPRETRVYLPREHDGTAAVTSETYGAVAEWAYWGLLPGDVLDRGRDFKAEKMAPRRVHAKVYRLWNFSEKRDLLIVGSVNLTSAAHSHGGAGNLEAAFLVDVSEVGNPRRWWLDRLDVEVSRFKEEGPSEEEGLEESFVDLSLRYNWASGELSYLFAGGDRADLDICETNGRKLFSISRPRSGRWAGCGSEAASLVREVLRSSSFLMVKHPRGSWRVLVREESMAHRPSLLTELTPEEILEYWSLLTAEQRADFIENRPEGGLFLEGLQLAERKRILSRDTLFDRFAGIFHAFGCLRRHVEEAIEEEREQEAEMCLAGAKYDSLPVLLEKTVSRENGDAVGAYVTFLCAEQLYRGLKRKHRSFFRGKKKNYAHLEELLGLLPEVRGRVALDDPQEREFLGWYEETFLKELG